MLGVSVTFLSRYFYQLLCMAYHVDLWYTYLAGFDSVYKTLCQRHLEFCTQLWSPLYVTSIKWTESMWNAMTKYTLNNDSYLPKLICDTSSLHTFRSQLSLIYIKKPFTHDINNSCCLTSICRCTFFFYKKFYCCSHWLIIVSLIFVLFMH